MIVITLSLMSLTGGAFLLGWARRNGEGLLLKIIAYVVMLASVLHIGMAIANHAGCKGCGREHCSTGYMHDRMPPAPGDPGAAGNRKCCMPGARDTTDGNEVGDHIMNKGQTK